MAEALTLTTPIVQTRTTYTLALLTLDWTGARIDVRLDGSDGESLTLTWAGAPATTLMVALNKANLTTLSLQKRVLQQAVTDGKLPAGTVTGAPA